MVKHSSPLVTVLMSVYNGERYLAEAVRSIIGQTFQDFEFLIINDASTDGSAQIIESFADSRICLHRNRTNIGLTASLNKGLALAKGQYIARMDADDISVPNRLADQVAYLEKHTTIGLCGGWFQIIDGALIKKPETHEEIAMRMLRRNPFGHSTVMMRRSVLDKFNLNYDETLSSSQDYDLWSRIIEHTRAYNIPKVLVEYRVHNNQISIKKRQEQLRNEAKIKKALLKKILPGISDDEALVHDKVVVSSDNISSVEFIKYAKFLEKLLEANSRTRRYEPEHLLEFVHTLWFSALKRTNRMSLTKALTAILSSPVTKEFSLLKKLNLVKKAVI